MQEPLIFGMLLFNWYLLNKYILRRFKISHFLENGRMVRRIDFFCRAFVWAFIKKMIVCEPDMPCKWRLNGKFGIVFIDKFNYLFGKLHSLASTTCMRIRLVELYQYLVKRLVEQLTGGFRLTDGHWHFCPLLWCKKCILF